jgi:uncharacterized protein (DUF1810 family)
VTDSFDLRRFVDVQEPVYPTVVDELSLGRKRSHWMWFIFPQITGLGFSAMAQRFAIRSGAEAMAYVSHDVLGPRLIACTRLVLAASEKTINEILGSPDDMKFRSCMTLFDAVSRHEVFAEAIGTFYPQKFAAQALPVVGALGGAAVNYAFMEVARGHFTVRRLERLYGKERIRAEYDAIAAAT